MKVSSMVTCLLAVAISSVMVTDVIGQEGRTEGRRGQGRGGQGGGNRSSRGFVRGGDPTMGLLRVEEVQAELQISPEQEEALMKLSEKARQRPEGMDFSKVRQMSEDERNEFFAKMREDQAKKSEEAKEQLEEVLLPPQLERLNQISLQQRGVQALGDEAVASELDISDEQKEKLAEVREGLRDTMRSRIQELMKKAGSEGGGFDREMFSKVQEELQEEVLGVLTSEQRAKFEEMKGEPFEMPSRNQGLGGSGGSGGSAMGGGGRGRGGRGDRGRGDGDREGGRRNRPQIEE